MPRRPKLAQPSEPPKDLDALRPRQDETLSQYVSRLCQTRGLLTHRVAQMTSHLPPQQRLSSTWLMGLMNETIHEPGGDKLRTLAALLQIPAKWLLDKA